MFLWEKLEAMKAEGLAEGRAEGIVEGIAKGEIKGIAKKEQEDVLSAIHEGLSKDMIMRIFKISAEEYEKYAAMI